MVLLHRAGRGRRQDLAFVLLFAAFGVGLDWPSVPFVYTVGLSCRRHYVPIHVYNDLNQDYRPVKKEFPVVMI